MHSLRTKILVMTVSMVVIAMVLATTLGVMAIRQIGNDSANSSMYQLCEVGQKNLDSYFESVEQSVKMVSAYVQSDLDGTEEEQLQAHLDRVDDVFNKLTYDTHGVLTYYYRIDPTISTNATGFWYVGTGDGGFQSHEPTDITKYDTTDTSQLVWFTVPKATGKGIWLPPYITDNLGARVISYNEPVYYNGTFIGVIGIEIDYSTMANEVNNITLYDHGYAFINDAEGNIIYHPYMDVTYLAEHHPKVPDGLLSDSNFVRYTFDGVEKQAVWLPLSNGMRLNVTVPVAEIDAAWQNWAISMVMAFSVLLILFIALILRFSSTITKPLQDLAEAALKVDRGNYDFTLEYDEPDEVGVLTHAFKKLVAHLQSYISDLSDLAFADALTGVRNKGAFYQHVKDVNALVNDPYETPEFAICIFDCNGLKSINDNFGHDKGDLYLKNACAIICSVFDHSPVFRIGGDEFAAILQGKDFANRDELIREYDEKCAESRDTGENRWEQVDVARGIAVYDSEEDESADDTTRRADKLMYRNKFERKGKLAQD